jgi:hypothetical protein
MYGSNRMGGDPGSWRISGTTSYTWSARSKFVAGSTDIVCAGGSATGSVTISFSFAKDPIIFVQAYNMTVVGDPFFFQTSGISTTSATINARNLLGNTGQTVNVHWYAVGESS